MLTLLGAIGSSCPVGSAASGRTYLVRLGDKVAVQGAHIWCGVASGSSSVRSPMVTCFIWRSKMSGTPIAGSYGFSIGDLGIAAIGVTPAPRMVYRVRYRFSSRGNVAPRSRARGVRLVTLGVGDALRVAESDLGCAVFRLNGPMLVCKRILPPWMYQRFNPPLVTLSDAWLRIGGAHLVFSPVAAMFSKKEPRP